MRRTWLWIGLGVLLLAPCGAWAEGASRGEGWDDSHMRSRHRSILAVKLPAAEVRGIDRYSKIKNSPDAKPHLRVPETLDAATQRGWEPGARTSTPKATARRGTGYQPLSASRHGGTPGKTTHPGSSLRSGVRSTSGR